ncbi:MAG: beta-ketoacyl-[acyl-carrier-protein] synthase family protein [Hallerella porci]|uniref:3-oxoacyl-[acyl-carrier-protein] synthase II n=1 Tax=Hallerella porci TaxID=1945871 RepID=A0ABX5LPW6_9BACT|nr:MULTISPECIES: beta-ketoacyl-[acyl-carrier-protein] synthase family protein [Hallerella]MCI5601353.1 beta-ketoacyl-[acyl-carrier-protein] synthase family protein [Hallerella sp.]MDY3921361.1 beta-ketoacyl-[acyl-carrier-protein] synthase family protein [Hallerella porci]PWL03348.1 3-oxoacyl-[acyl-carrier-protein] synthase II [Hallerella porci]
MTSNDRRCVVTGLGVICAVGNNVEETWKNALNSVSGIHKTTSVDTDKCYADLAAEVHCDTLDEIDHPEEKDRASKLCIKAAKEALADANLSDFADDQRVSVIIGSCVGGVISVEHYNRHGKNALDIPKMPIASIASQVAETCRAGGIVTNVANACAAGTISIALACDLIRSGKADVVIAGGADSFAAVPYSGFLSLHALDENGCSPFNHCNGITLGEGAGIVIVESFAHAEKRKAKTYCEVLGAGVTSDAHHITAPREDALCLTEAMNRAVKNSGIQKKDIGYVNAHGTGTGKNDNAEITAFTKFFGEENPTVSVSSTKVMTGHCLGAAGAIEAVFSIKALTTNTVLPTLHYSAEDSEALKAKVGALDFVQNVPHEKELQCVMSNNVAFGGTNASIIFSKKAGNVQALSAKDKKIAVTGLGIVCPLGNSKDAYIAAVEKDAKPESASIHSTIALDDYKELGIKMAFYRKLDNLGQLQTVSGMRALQDGNFKVSDENAKDIGIIVGTSEGGLGATYDFEELIAKLGNAQGSAFKFPHTVYNAAGGYLSICSGIKGYGVTITTGPLSGLDSIGYSMNVIHDGQEHAMMATGTDENLPIITEFAQKLNVAADQVVAPYSNSNGCVVGDGSVSILMEADDFAKSRGAKIYCYALGYGNGRKNVNFGHISGSDSALDLAIREALADAKISVDDIDAVCGFANGYAKLDAIEKSSLSRVFGDRLEKLPLIEVKERVGEGRAGSAALAAAEAALLLSGELKSENAYFVGKDGAVKTQKIDAADLKKVLVISFATGGSYSAVVLGK